MSWTPVYDVIENGGPGEVDDRGVYGVELRFRLITSVDDDPWAPGFTNTGIILDRASTLTEADGSFSVWLRPNSEADPQNTVWRVDVPKLPRGNGNTHWFITVPVAELDDDDEPIPVRLRDLLTSEPSDLPSPLRWGNLADVDPFVSTNPRDNAIPFFDPEVDEWNQSQRFAIFDDSTDPYFEVNTGGDGNDKVAHWVLHEDGVWSAEDRLAMPARVQGADPTVDGDLATKLYTDAADALRVLLSELTERVQDIVAGFATQGAHISITYSDVGNTLTFAVTGLASTDLSDFTEAVQDVVGGLAGFGNTGLSFSYNDGANTVTLNVNVDDSSIEINADALRVKALGVTNAMLAGGIVNGKLATDPLARANHTGTQLLATISDAGTAASKNIDNDGTLAANSAILIPTQAAVKSYADALIGAANGIVYKGVIDCSANPNYPAADAGHEYRVSVAGKIGGGAGPNVEVGDLLLCLTDGTGAGTHAGVGANWNISQVNIDGAVVGPAAATDGNVVVFNGTSGKVIKDGGTLGTAAFVATGTGAGNAILGNDARLTDTRTPTDNTVTSAKIVDGTIVNADINAGAAIALSKLATDPLARANHTGQQLLATISDAGALAALSAVGSAQITDGSVANGDLANMPANTIKVNATNGAAAPTDMALTASTFPAMLASGSIVAATGQQGSVLINSAGFKKRTTNQVVTSSAVLVNDDTMTVTTGIAGSFKFECWLYYDGATTGDLQVAFTATNLTGSGLLWGGVAPQIAISAANATQANLAVASGSGTPLTYGAIGLGNGLFVLIKGLLVCSASSVLQLQWAQAASSATSTTVYAGSYLHVQQMS